MKNNIDPHTKIIAVIKADGYGHGAVPLARMFEKMDYIWGYAVATVEEGIQLRIAGMKKPILLLGGLFPDQYEDLINNEIRMNIYSTEIAEHVISCAKRIGKKAYGHIKIDTGMGRLGFTPDASGIQEILDLEKSDFLEMEGIFTHFAKADEIDKAFSMEQIRQFEWVADELKKKGITFNYYHCANSAGIVESLTTSKDLVRAGISIYGLYPSEEVDKETVKLTPAMTLTASVSYVKMVPEGTPISYGSTFVTKRETKVATIPVGYADGYPRTLSNCGYVLLHGRKAPILGRVCMDQFMVDATDIPEVAYGDTAVLIGESHGETISIEDLAKLSGRFNYEFICDLSKRIPREYISHGNVIEQKDYFTY